MQKQIKLRQMTKYHNPWVIVDASNNKLILDDNFHHGYKNPNQALTTWYYHHSSLVNKKQSIKAYRFWENNPEHWNAIAQSFVISKGDLPNPNNEYDFELFKWLLKVNDLTETQCTSKALWQEFFKVN